MNHRFADHPLAETVTAFLVLMSYVLVWNAASLILGGAPGDWPFASTMLFPLPVALLALRLGAGPTHSGAPAVRESTVLAAAAALAVLALPGTRPGVSGSLAHLPASAVAVLGIAIAEEALFRGALLPVLARRFGYAWAIVFSALLFGAIHLDSGRGPFLAALLLGVALGGLYLRSGLGACIAFHTAFNFMAGPIFGQSVGGLPWSGLLEPALPRNPLDFWAVQLGCLVLALWWVPWRVVLARREAVAANK